MICLRWFYSPRQYPVLELTSNNPTRPQSQVYVKVIIPGPAQLDWVNRNLLAFNVSKTQMCSFSTKRFTNTNQAYMGDPAFRTACYNLVWLSFDDDLIWNKHFVMCLFICQKVRFPFSSEIISFPQSVYSLYFSR